MISWNVLMVKIDWKIKISKNGTEILKLFYFCESFEFINYGKRQVEENKIRIMQFNSEIRANCVNCKNCVNYSNYCDHI